MFLCMYEKYISTKNTHYIYYINKKISCIDIYLHIYFACLYVCLYPINVKTAESIGPKFFVGHHVTTGKVYE